MTRIIDVAVLVGSLRKASFTRKVAKGLIDAAPAALRCRAVDLGDLSIYNEDLEDDVPAAWARFRESIAAVDAILFVTPEYNRSIPGCLKNALDVGSRPQGRNVWAGKPAAIVSVTPYKLGAFGANHAIRQALVFLNVPAMQQPEAYISGAADLFDANGALKSEETREFLAKFMASFEQWTTRLVVDASSHGFDEFMSRRAEVAAAYSSGEIAPLEAIVARAGAATFFPPPGGHVAGAGEVAARYAKDVKSFSPGGTTRLEVLQCHASGAMAFWTGFQDFHGKIGDREVTMKLRVTEVFRREGDAWVLVHRHADTAAQPGRS